jgi:hypothetical protein
MEALARRLERLFSAHPRLEVVILYWQRGPRELRGVAFHRDLRPPVVQEIRPASLRRYLACAAPFLVPDAILA